VRPHKRVRYRNKSGTNRIVVPSVSVLFLAPGIAFIVTGITAGSSQGVGGPHAIGLGAFLTLSGLGFLVTLPWPQLVLTTHTLRRPKVLHRAQITPLDQVTGIGLVYKRTVGAPAPLGWFLYVWTAGDVPCNVGIAYQPARWLYPADKVRQKFLAVEPSATEVGKTFDRYRFAYYFNPVTQTDPDKLAATYAGRVAREIYDRVLAYQGPSGLLAARQDQKRMTEPGADFVFWSPDGELGSATAAQSLGQVLTSDSSPPPGPPGPMLRVQYGARLVRRAFRRRGGDDRDSSR
jgi:hypothetical protein